VKEVRNEAGQEQLSAVLAPAEDALLERLRPGPKQRWLDLATGVGGVALRAARAGAEVTAIDSDEPMLERARSQAEEEGLTVRFDAGDVEYLPYDDGEFDVLVSNFGFIVATDHANVAAELARVAKPEASLGFTAWKPNPKLGELYRRFTDEPLEGRESTEWGREDHVEALLGDDFELEFDDGVLWIDADSGEELWQLFSRTAPPVVALRGRLDDEGWEEFHRAFVALYEGYRTGNRVRAPRRYLLSLGRRR
jgi:SAM-dependent methyltransferase